MNLTKQRLNLRWRPKVSTKGIRNFEVDLKTYEGRAKMMKCKKTEIEVDRGVKG